jgi:hypothetical protein
MIANQVRGWVFIGFPDEHLRSLLRVGATRLWDDARTIGKQPGQPVLFLQTRARGAGWVGAGIVKGVEERWKSFGVYVETRTVLSRMIAAVARGPTDGPTSPDQAAESIRARGMAAWENRTLATRIGFEGFRSRTPFSEEGRDLRLTASDWNLLCRLQPSLRNLWPG